MSTETTLRRVGQVPGRATSVARPGRRRKRGPQLKSLLIACVFLAPLAVFYGIYYFYGFGFLAQVSTEQVSLSFLSAVNVGWDNFRLVLTDSIFQRSLLNNLALAAFSVFVALTLGFLVAMMLASGLRARRLIYTVVLLPSLIPLSLFATVFGRMLDTRDGAINELLRNVGLGFMAQDWIVNEPSAYAALGILLTFMIGLPVIYYTADLGQVNGSILEAATLDGASVWQIFRLILFPVLRNTHTTVIIAAVLGSFRAFDIVFFSTGGQPGGRTGIIGTYIYSSALGSDRVGFAAAASIIVLVIALSLSLVQLIFGRKNK